MGKAGKPSRAGRELATGFFFFKLVNVSDRKMFFTSFWKLVALVFSSKNIF